MFTELAVCLDAPAQFIVPGTLARTMVPIVLVKDTSPLLRIRFYRDQAIVGLPSDYAMTMVLRRADEWNPSTNLAIQATWDEVQYGDSDVYYEAELDLGLEAMQDYFKLSRQSARVATGTLTIESETEGLFQVPFRAMIFLGQEV